jgi:hypothetical protein
VVAGATGVPTIARPSSVTVPFTVSTTETTTGLFEVMLAVPETRHSRLSARYCACPTVSSSAICSTVTVSVEVDCPSAVVVPSAAVTVSSNCTGTLTGRINKSQTLTRTVGMGAGAVEWTLDWNESRVDLDLRVREPQGDVVVFDGGSARPKTGAFTAATAGDYTIQLINNTNRRTNYTLTVTHPAG